jgi:superfamily I DNA/RNA helicase
MFNFPRYEEIKKDKQQLKALMEPHQKKLITGPPGSGKTVVALFLAREMDESEKIKYLVYNNTLNDYIEAAIRNNAEIQKVKSNAKWHSWFRSFYKEKTGQEVPRKYDDDDFIYDWSKIIPNLAEKINNDKPMDTLVIDEGQDMPPEFYYFVSFISKSFYVFADENQTITDHNSTIKDIENNLGKDLVKYHLNKNHRNTLPIAELSSKFYVGLEGGIPELPKHRPSKDNPLFYTKPESEQLALIKTYCRNNAKKNIGIFLPDNKAVKNLYLQMRDSFSDRIDYYHGEKYYDCPSCLEGKLVERKGQYGNFFACNKWSKNNPNSCSYKWTKRYNGILRNWPPKQIRYNQSSIIILTYNSTKGLEFDTVIIPFLKTDYYSVSNDNNKMKFYVLTSRAKNELIFMKEGKSPIEIIENIPDISKYIIFK